MIEIPQKLKPENFMIESGACPAFKTNIIPIPKRYIQNCSFSDIKKFYLREYKNMFERDFKFTEESKILFYTIVYYFLGDQRFLNSPYLIKPQGTKPSFTKGLLIIGNTGTGKTSILLTLEKVFNTYVYFDAKIYFRSISAHQVVNDFEKLKNPEEKDDFFLKHQRAYRFYDDVKSESDASNFGKENLFKKILYLRNEKRLKTIITCNYDPSYSNDFEKGLDEFGIRYDGRIYDRLFSDFNFIESRGKSLRD